jgi:hypothetical protein
MFPSVSYLASTIQLMIPALTADQADESAQAIIDLNDAGQFEEAWDVLGEMLEWQTAEKNA